MYQGDGSGCQLRAGILGLLLLFPLFLFGCASSDVSREAASNIDMGVQNAKKLADGMADGDVPESYQNANQAAKGALVAGSAGAVTGLMASGVGIIPGAAVGALMGASYGSYIDSESSLQDKLMNRGANIVVLGDQVMVVIPSARLFNPMTSDIKTQAYSTLDLLAQYINSYTKVMVKISAYTNKLGSERVSLAMSDQQAKNVSKYLERSGVDARVLYAAGYGGTHLVAQNSLEWDQSDNYRIEITLEKITA
jgi:outer membrane protein OmpA-like peptidoglycan-associated protein